MPDPTNLSDVKILLNDKYVRIILAVFTLTTLLIFVGFYFLQPVLAENPEYVTRSMSAVQNYGIMGVFLITFLAETLIPFPLQPVIGAMAVLDIGRIALMLVIATLASLLGNLTSFYLARLLREKFVYKYIHKSTLTAFDSVWKRRGDLILIITSIIPILPGNIVAFVSGLSNMNVKRFSLIIVIGRGLMFVLVIWMAVELAGSWFPWIFGMQ